MNNPSYNEILGRWGDNVELVRGAPMGEPQTYNNAIEGLPLVVAFFSVNPSMREAPEIPQFDVILDIAPMVFDEYNLNGLDEILRDLHCVSYPASMAREARERLSAFKMFYESLKAGTQYKQTELKKMWFESVPNAENLLEPTRVFYVWCKFGLMEREKISNRIYLTPVTENKP